MDHVGSLKTQQKIPNWKDKPNLGNADAIWIHTFTEIVLFPVSWEEGTRKIIATITSKSYKTKQV